MIQTYRGLVLALLAVAVLISSCGGGGGGSTTTDWDEDYYAGTDYPYYSYYYDDYWDYDNYYEASVDNYRSTADDYTVQPLPTDWLDLEINQQGWSWYTTYEEEHLAIEVGDTLFTPSAFLFSSSDVSIVPTTDGDIVHLTSPWEGTSFLTYGLKGFKPGQEITGIEVYGSSPYGTELNYGLYVGLSRITDGEWSYYWCGPFATDRRWKVRLYGIDNVAEEVAYITVALFDGDAADLYGVRISVDD